jgi:hypothetical protein
LEQKSCHFSISAEECRMRNGIFLIPATPDLLRNGKITVKNGLFNMIYIVHNLHFRLAAGILNVIIPPLFTGSKTVNFSLN